MPWASVEGGVLPTTPSKEAERQDLHPHACLTWHYDGPYGVPWPLVPPAVILQQVRAAVAELGRNLGSGARLLVLKAWCLCSLCEAEEVFKLRAYFVVHTAETATSAAEGS